MTAETLKPFITPTSVDNFPATHSSTTHRQRSSNVLMIGLGVTSAVLVTVSLLLAVWCSIELTSLKTEVQTLNNVVAKMQKHLGSDYLEDLHNFEKEYANALIDDPSTLDDVDADDDYEDNDDSDSDDEDDDDNHDTPDEYEDMKIKNYDDLVKKYKSYDDDSEEDTEEEEENRDSSDDDDNLYDDFEKFQDSKKKKKPSTIITRKERSIAVTTNKLLSASKHAEKNETSNAIDKHESSDDIMTAHKLAKIHKLKLRSEILNRRNEHPARIVSHDLDTIRSPLRPPHTQRRKIPVIRSGDSLISAKTAGATQYFNHVPLKPAAHFHLNSRVPDRHSAIRVQSYAGDMYIGHPTLSNEMDHGQYFVIENGVLKVLEPGLYYVYAQVCYNNTYDQNGFVIFHGHKPFLQCLNTVPTNMHKIHTCHTSGLIHLKENETIHLRDFHSDRSVVLKDSNNRSYFGLMKI